jgi:hypothetical protein
MLLALIIVPLALLSDKQDAGRQGAFICTFILGPLVIWLTAWSSRKCFRGGSWFFGILLALFALVAVAFEIAFFVQWLHPGR